MRSLGANDHLNNVLVVRVANASNLLHVCAIFFNLQHTHIIIITKSAQRTSEGCCSALPLQTFVANFGSTLFLHGVCMLRECIYGECAHEQHIWRTLILTLTHTITAYLISGNIVRVRILICATIQKPCRNKFTPILRTQCVLRWRHKVPQLQHTTQIYRLYFLKLEDIHKNICK